MPNLVAMNVNYRITLLTVLALSFLITIRAGADNPPGPSFVSCGASGNGKDDTGRTWHPDTKFLVSRSNSTTAKAEVQDPSLPSNTPYMTARIFQSEGNYQFTLQNSSERTLIRLHFYPSSYPKLNISNSYFSVAAGGYTLLTNFSADLSAHALSQSYFIKEYFLPPTSNITLKITFKPADKSFAFINGIEVASSPPIFNHDPDLAGSAVDPSFGPGLDLQDAITVPVSGIAMETMYRLNVGGGFISPTNDSGGLGRSWYEDSVYIFGAAQGVAVKSNITVSYKSLPPQIAPLDVYGSYRSMGAFKDVNKGANLTWVFEVHPDYMYMLRLHWCDSEMKQINQRVFDVLVNDKIASSQVDLFSMTGAFATPMTEDFVVRISNGTAGELRLTLRPSDATSPEFFDVLLNGVEIFKLSDETSKTLAGPNPSLSDLMEKYQSSYAMAPKAFVDPHKSKTNKTVVIGGAAGGAAAIGLAAVIFVFAHERQKRALEAGETVHSVSWLPISWNSSTKTASVGKNQASVTISTDAASNCRYFSLAEIKSATKQFDDSHVIGVGGFGKVYKGIIDGDTQVAIKRSNPSSEQGANEFQTEIEMLSRLRHRHLVSLIGFCEDNGEMILVYDYMGKGTLRQHLYKGNKTTLSWKQRLEISIGAARGLHYLHTGAKYTIIHRDVKTTNILVDDKWVAKVSDFGLSKTGPNMNKGHVSTIVKGSFGYLDPEYFRRQQLTEKSDVYSFGVVLFEVLCARPALNASLPKEQVSLADWALRCARNNTLEEIVDPQLKGKISPDCLKRFAETAVKCLSDHGTDRPTMGDVLWGLECALQHQESFEGGSSDSVKSSENVGKETNQNDIIAMHRSILSLDDPDDEKEKTKDEEESEEVFSMFLNQKGR